MASKNRFSTNSVRRWQQPVEPFRATHCHPMTTQELTTMLDDKGPLEILQRIAAAQGSFKRLLEEKHTDQISHLHQMKLIVKVLHLGFSQNKQMTTRQLLVDVAKIFIDSSPFHNKILDSLYGPLGTDVNYVEAVLGLLQVSIEIFPKKAGSELSQLLTVVDALVNTKHRQLIKGKDETKELFKNSAFFSPTKRNGETKSVQKYQVVDRATFQERSILPTPQDFEPFDGETAVRKQRAYDCYQYIYDYLESRFQLLRDGPVMHLRKNIIQFQSGWEDIIGVHHQVRILQPVYHEAGLCFRLSFAVKRPSAVSKTLHYGSLLCLSNDIFKTFLTAVVETRDPKELTKGFVDVRFIRSTRETDFNTDEHEAFINRLIESRNQQFVMAESPVDFETYANILAGLQGITEDTLPFWDYIGHGEARVRCPQYLNMENAKYDFRPVLDQTYAVTDDEDERRAYGREAAPGAAVDILDVESWPSAKRLGLDESQFAALQSALTKEFSIIQGPPGTGKTFIALMVLKLLLHNKNVWSENGESKPILLVCNSEQALDQLLKGIVGTFEGIPVRVAPKSRCERLEEFNLRGVGHRARENRMASPEVHRERREIRKRMGDLKADIKKFTAELEILETDIVTASVLKNYIRKDLYKSLTSRKNIGDVFMEWLEITRDREHIEGSGEYKEMQSDELRESFREKFVLTDGRKNDYKKAVNIEEETYKNTSFNISEYGDEEMPPQLTDREKQRWKSLIHVKKNYRSIILNFLKKPDAMSEQNMINVMNVWSLCHNKRWQLYRYWVKLCTTEIKKELGEKVMLFDQLARRRQNQSFEEDRQTLEKATLVAMTTTEAARYQSILQKIGPKIVLIEGASSVAESQVITLLGAQCQHLVLIGDHKQPRLSSSYPNLKGQQQVETSLLERLVTNGFEHMSLRYQHRMRPEIYQLLRVPQLYPELRDHDKVLCYPHINNVKGDLRFIRHWEQEEREEETKSFCNKFEARYVVGLLEYLLLQGYEARQITILTPYAGQINLIRKLLKSGNTPRQIEGVEISSVDNYQGKENDIILLSLVRSNKSRGIGFLKENNRICVAFSRARMGQYVIGNFAVLSESSPLISQVEQIVKLVGHVSDTIELVCACHGNETIISSLEDFKKVPEGGCLKPCAYRQDNGISCKRICHADDPDHKFAVPFQSR